MDRAGLFALGAFMLCSSVYAENKQDDKPSELFVSYYLSKDTLPVTLIDVELQGKEKILQMLNTARETPFRGVKALAEPVVNKILVESENIGKKCVEHSASCWPFRTVIYNGLVKITDWRGQTNYYVDTSHLGDFLWQQGSPEVIEHWEKHDH